MMRINPTKSNISFAPQPIALTAWRIFSPVRIFELLAHLDLADIGGGTGSDSWGWKDPLTSRYYALIGRSNGTAFVDITDPQNPIYLGNLPTQANSSVWRDLKTYNNYVFIVADGQINHGMQVFDLTRLRNVDSAPEVFSPTAVYGGFSEAHNIAINPATGFAYAVGGDTCMGGLHMIDIRDPLNPGFAGCFSADGYTHDAQCVIYEGPDSEHRGNEICFASNEDTVTVIDVSDKANPVMLSRTGYDSQYTHQGWLTQDQRYFLLDDELDELSNGHNTRTLVWDMTDLDNPRISGEHIADEAGTDHNQYVIGDFAFQANYQRGLRILRINDPATADLQEVAFIDTYPEANANGFSGAWNVYPFFDNGLVLISDANRGLFIVRPQLPDNPQGIGAPVRSNPNFSDAEGLYLLRDTDGNTVAGSGLAIHLLDLPDDHPSAERVFMFAALYDYTSGQFPSVDPRLSNNETFRTLSGPLLPFTQ